MVVAEERWASVLLWWAFDFDPEILLMVALKEKLDSRLGFIVKGPDVTSPSGLAWLCLLKIGILDLLAWRLVLDSLRRPLRESDRSCWEASLSPRPT
jgi:hypothetical protein